MNGHNFGVYFLVFFLSASRLRNAIFELNWPVVGVVCWPLEHSRYLAKNINIGVAGVRFKKICCVLITFTCFFFLLFFHFLDARRPHVRPLRNTTLLAGVVKL